MGERLITRRRERQMSNVRLDVYAGEKNGTLTGLGQRIIRVGLGYDYEEIRGEGEVLWIAASDGDVGNRVLDISWRNVDGRWYGGLELGGYRIKRATRGGEELEVLEGGLCVLSLGGEPDSEVLLEGVGYWWTSNDSERERFRWEGGTWKLLGGGRGEVREEVVGDVLEGLLLELGDELVIDGGRYIVGGEDLPILDSEPEGDWLGYGYVLLGELHWGLGSESDRGMGIVVLRGRLGVVSSRLRSGDYLSPSPHMNEYPLLRRVGGDYYEGYEIEGGRVYFSGVEELEYSGLVLCDRPVGMELESELVGGYIEEGSFGVSGHEGGGFFGNLLRGSYILLGSGEVLRVVYGEVDEKSMRVGEAYVSLVDLGRVGGKRIYDFSGAKYGTGLVWLDRGGLGYVSSRGIGISSGEIYVNGESVSWSEGELLSGSDLVELDGYGYMRILGSVESLSGDLDKLGLVPHERYAGGVCLSVGSFGVRGYISYDGEEVGEVSAGLGSVSILGGIGGEVNLWRGGEEIGLRHFRVGSAGYLVRGEDIAYDLDMGGSFTWLGRVSKVGLVRGVLDSVESGSGVLEMLGLSVGGIGLEEGLDYEVLYGLGGRVRFKKEVMGEVSRGLRLEEMDLGVGNYVLGSDGYWRRVLEGGLLSSTERLDESGLGWVEYAGYDEGGGEPDPSKLLGECWERLRPARRSVEVYCIRGISEAWGFVHPTSELYLRQVGGLDDVYYPLVVLKRREFRDFYVMDSEYRGGYYRLEVGGVVYEEGVIVSGKGFTRASDGRIDFVKDGVLDSGWVTECYYKGVPRPDLLDRAEVSVGYDDLSSPFGEGVDLEVMELLSEDRVKYEVSTGSISFAEPLGSGIGVEVSYIPEGELERVLESSLFLVLEESAVLVGEGEFSYGGLEKGVDLDIAPSVWVGSELLVGGYRVTGDRIYCKAEGDVRISYYVSRSLGGEYVVKTGSGITEIEEVSIAEGGTSLKVEGVGVGDMLDVGGHLFMVTAVGAGLVSVFPSARYGLKTREVSVLRSSGYVFRSVLGVSCKSRVRGTEITLGGDLRGLIKGLVVVGGVPYRVVSVEFKDGVTILRVLGQTSAHETDSLLVSMRDVLVEGSLELPLLSGVLRDKGYRLIRYVVGEGLGYELEEGVDYVIGESSIRLSVGIEVGEEYYLKHTAQGYISERVLSTGEVEYPTYEMEYVERRVPSSGYVGKKIYAKCLIYAPDVFYFRTVNDTTYAGEVERELLDSLRIEDKRGYGGKLERDVRVKRGLSYGYFDLLASDVVARNKIKQYNGFIEPIDCLLSSVMGKLVGDGDGIFRFELLDGLGAGLEDPIKREITPRYLVETGSVSSVVEFKELREGQRALVENEMDDFALVGYSKRMSQVLELGYPFVKYEYDPIYSPLWKPSVESRLFPQSAKMMSYRAGGDLYFLRGLSSTFGEVIGLVENPALGRMQNVSSLSLTKRGGRFRVVAYSAVGFPAYAPSSSGRPSLILSAVSLQDFPIDISTGYPDTARFISQGGDVSDVVVGSLDRVFGGLSVGDKVELGVDGVGFSRVLDMGRYAYDITSVFSLSGEPRNATIKEIVNGCVVVLNGSATNLEAFGGVFMPKRGDTILQSFALDLDEEGKSVVYRVGADVGLRSASGEIIDLSLPSGYDPNYPIKELLGQNVPEANEALEGDVVFGYSSLEPYGYPALRGEVLNDDGDETIPFRKPLTERDVLITLPPYLERLTTTTDNEGTLEYAYPDEVRDNGVVGDDGVLTASYDYTALEGECVQVPREGDLLVFEDRLLELAYIEGTELMPPRFPASNVGGYLSLSVSNALVYHLADNDVGVQVKETLSESILGSGKYDVSTAELVFSNTKYRTYFLYLDYLAGEGIANNQIILDVWKNGGLFRYGRFTFTRGLADWSVTFQRYLGSVQTPNSLVSISYLGDTLTIVDNPTINPNVPPLPAFTGETWLFKTSSFWGDLSASVTGETISTTIGGSPWYMDFHLGYDAISTSCHVPSDRVSIRETYPLFGAFEVQGSYTTSVRVLDSGFVVMEEGGVSTAIVSSDVNNTEQLNAGIGFEVKEVLSDGLLFYGFRSSGEADISLGGVGLSIMVGSEVDEADVIYKGLGDLGLVSGGIDYGKGVIRNLSEDASGVRDGDLVYVSIGHNAGLQRVKFYTEGVTDGVVEAIATQSVVVGVQFPKVIGLSTLGISATLQTDSLELSKYFNETGDFIVLLTEGYRSRPLSTTLGVYDRSYGRSALRISYVSRTESAFVFSEANVAYLDGTAVNLSELFGLLGEDFGQSISGHKKAGFDLSKTDFVPYEAPCTLGATLDLSLSIAGGLSIAASLDALVDEDGVVYGIEWGTLDDVQDENSYGEAFLLPLDIFRFEVSVIAGIYLDKSFPRLVGDYATPALFGDGSSQVRSPLDYTLDFLPVYPFTERVSLMIRRPRRFTDVVKGVVEGISSFRYVYEQRQGLVDDITDLGNGSYSLTALSVDYLTQENADGTDTQIGNFPSVCKAGDQVFLYDEVGVETLRLRIVLVEEGELTCEKIRGSVVEGVSFKIRTRVGIVPLLQSFESYFNHGFDVIVESPAMSGISVDTEGVLTDLNADFTGVEVGDYLVIDPQGKLLNSEEYGYPPRGDQGFVGQANYVEGSPHELDDNRGAYRVIEVGSDYLMVEESVGDTQRSSYNLLPTIGGVVSNPLRVTAGVVVDTYATTTDSIHPFSYRVVRMKNGLVRAVAEEFLFYRERTLSWAERVFAFNAFPQNMVTWEEYEQQDYMTKAGIGDPTHPANDVLLDNIKGLTGLKPFVNTDTCLGVLDRRFMGEDPLLETEGYGEVESALPSVLDDGLALLEARENRLAWINIRTHQTNGTLAKMSRINYNTSTSTATALRSLQNG